MILKKALIATAIPLLFLVTGCSDSSTTSTKAEAPSAQIVSTNEYTLTSLSGEKFQITKEADEFIVKGYENKIVIFDLFATWCPPCRAEATHLSAIQDKYKDSVKIIGITIEQGLASEKLVDFSTQYNATYSLVNSPDNQKVSRLIASSIRVGERFPIPLMVMYKDGKYVTHYAGAVPQEMIESDIDTVLSQK
ncbi:MAG: TlpA disulfide reductase family protein [Campylobacterota bacterium]|nr:TlpA disulfide reductase family protein [Campylobacterota bacterium]